MKRNTEDLDGDNVDPLVKRSRCHSENLTLVEGAVVIDQIKNKDDTPTMRDLNRYVTKKYAVDWHDIGVELGLELGVLDVIEEDYPRKSERCFQKVLDKWLKLTPNATWKTLEVALTNVRRQQLSLDPVDDVYVSSDKFISSGNNISNDAKENAVDRLTNDLRADYKTTRQRPQEEEWPPDQPTSIVSVALIHYKHRRTQQELIEISKRFKEGASAVDKLASSHSSVTKDISKIFTYTQTSTSSSEVESEPLKRILIEGAPGIGKTVLAKEIAFQWSKGELLKECKLVFLLYLRDPRVHTIKSITDLLKLFTVEETPQELEKFVTESRGKNVAFVFDGFDEYPAALQHNSLITDIIKREGTGRLLQQSIVVVTSRPTATLFLHRVVDRRIEILGFAKEERDKYISLLLKDFPEERNQELGEYLKQHPIINGLCFLPLYLAILLFLFQMDSLPKTLTEMNEFFIVHTIYRYLRKTVPSDERVVKKLTDLPGGVYEFVKKLAKLAYEGLECNKLVFSYEEIKKVCPEIDDTPGAINGFGLLQAVQHYVQKGAGRTTSFNFLHFTMQEYLAALHVSTLPNKKQLLLMKKTFWDGQFNFMWIMFAGIVRIQANVLVNFLSEYDKSLLPLSKDLNISDFVVSGHPDKLVLSKDIQNDKRKCLHLFQCYMEAKRKEIPEVIISIFSDGIINLTGMTLLPHHISSLIYFMSTSTVQQWRTLDLRNCNLRSVGMNSLLEHVIKNEQDTSTLEYVDLSGNDSSPWGVYCVIIRHCCVNSLTLCGDDGMEEYVQEITASLETNRGLESLTLRSIGKTGVESMTMVLVDNKIFDQVDVSWNRIRGERTNMMLRFKKTHLHSLNDQLVDINILYDNHCNCLHNEIRFSNENVNDDVVAMIVFGLSHRTRVYKCAMLDHRNRKNILDGNNALKELDLAHNKITSIGMKYLPDAVKSTSTLEYVDLSGNDSSPWGVYCVIIRHCCVDSLTLCGDDGMKRHLKEITNSLEENIKLKSLTLCSIGQTGEIVIKNILMGNTTLRKVNLSRMKLSNEVIQRNKDNILSNAKILPPMLTSTSAIRRVVNVNIFWDAQCYKTFDPSTSYDALSLVRLGLYYHFSNMKCDISRYGISDQDFEDMCDDLRSGTKCLYPVLTQKVLSFIAKLSTEDVVCDLSGKTIGDAGTLVLSTMLCNNANVIKLDVSCNKLTDVGALAIGYSLKNNITLQELNLNNNIISDIGAIAIAMQANCALKKLNVSSNQITANGAAAIIDNTNSSSCDLIFSHNKITDTGILHIAKSTEVCTTLQLLDISQNSISEFGITSLCSSLKSNTSLLTLIISLPKTKGVIYVNGEGSVCNMANKQLGDTGAQIVSALLYSNTNVIKLDVSGNQIRDDGTIAISDCLKNNSMLQEIILSCNNISVVGATKIAEIIQVNTTLQKLDISCCGIPDDGAVVISESYKSNKTLQELITSWNNDQVIVNTVNTFWNLSNKNIGNTGALIVSNLLHDNTMVKQLNISYNNISEDGAVAISCCLTNNSTLEELDMSGNDINQETVEAVFNAIKLSSSLKRLHVV